MNRLEETPGRIQRAVPVTWSHQLVAFFAGCTISYIGDMLTLLAIPWFVLQTTGSMIQMGMTAFCSTVPAVFSAFFGSALCRRDDLQAHLYHRRYCQWPGRDAGSFALPYGGTGLLARVRVGVLGGLLNSPGITARRSMLPGMSWPWMNSACACWLRIPPMESGGSMTVDAHCCPLQEASCLFPRSLLQ